MAYFNVQIKLESRLEWTCFVNGIQRGLCDPFCIFMITYKIIAHSLPLVVKGETIQMIFAHWFLVIYATKTVMEVVYHTVYKWCYDKTGVVFLDLRDKFDKMGRSSIGYDMSRFKKKVSRHLTYKAKQTTSRGLTST